MTMSLKCSILGCKWGETEVERERDENGSEVITTIRETETCTRCGDVRVVSENKEVTTLETAADIVTDDLEAGSGAASSPGADGEAGDPPETSEGAGATIPNAESDTAVTTAGTDESGSTGPPPEDVEDDAVILDDEPEGNEPTTEEEAVSEPESLGDTDPDEEAEILENTETTDEDGERAPGQWPEEPDDGDDWEQPTEVGRAGDEEPSGFGTVGNTVTVPEGEFYCPECEYATTVESSSLREGDYCPECHRGSLKHRPE